MWALPAIPDVGSRYRIVMTSTVARVARNLPPALVRRARAAAEAGLEPVPTRDAATVVLLRDGLDGPETYLLRRVPSMTFAAGMYVFPGGVVDPRDADADLAWRGPVPSDWAGRLSADAALAGALVCAAVRETFEESGVLLASPADDPADTIVEDTRDAGWEADRQALVDHSLAFSALLARGRLALRADLLAPWAHWITPEFEERRYDTRFFVAAMPARQLTRDVGGEADRVTWVRPADAVRAANRGEAAMLAPTLTTLDELATFPEVAAILAAAPTRRIAPILPRAVVDGDDVRLLVPGDPGYDAAGDGSVGSR
jgi:8-oxo-dGTP pyrophosphatase MutT (NUDIX family)